MKTLTILAATLIFTSSLAKADDRHRPHREPHRGESCIVEDWSKIKEEVINADKCEVVRPLKLKEMVKTYPLINVGPLKVRYWDASLKKTVRVVETFEHSYINVCTGVKTYSVEKTRESLSSKQFDLQNPNLDDEISESFKLAPMTNAEAKEAYEALAKECEFVRE